MIKETMQKATTLEELKAIYKALAMKHHPDRGGDLETMKAINAEYDRLFETLKTTHKTKDGETYTKATTETAAEFKDIIDKLIRLDGIIIEVIGCFIWVSGETKKHREELKALGFRFHGQKKVWYKAPAGYRKKWRNNHTYEMDEIRGMYGTSGQFTGNAGANLQPAF